MCGLHCLYIEKDITRVMGWRGNAARMGDEEDEKSLLGRPRCKWENNIKVDAK